MNDLLHWSKLKFASTYNQLISKSVIILQVSSIIPRDLTHAVSDSRMPFFATPVGLIQKKKRQGSNWSQFLLLCYKFYICIICTLYTAYRVVLLLFLHPINATFITTIDYILYPYLSSLISYNLYMITSNWYNIRDRRVHLTEASSIGFVQNVNCILWNFWVYHVQPGVSVL